MAIFLLFLCNFAVAMATAHGQRGNRTGHKQKGNKAVVPAYHVILSAAKYLYPI